MGYNSQEGHVGFKTQASKGSYLTPGGTAPNQGVFVRTRSGSMSGERELLIPDPEIGGNRDVPDAQLGPIKFSGSFDFYPRMEALSFFLKAVLGSASSSGAEEDGYNHNVVPANTIPWVSVEEQVAGGYETFGYTDGKVNTLHLEAEANGYFMGTADILALTQATVTASATKRWDTSPLIVGTNIIVSWGGVQLPAKSFSLDINNNIEDDDFRLGSLFLGDLVPKRREVTMGVTIRPENHNLWRTATWGSPAASVPGGQSFKDDVEVTLVTYEDISGADPGIVYECTFTVPQAIIKPFTATPSGDDVLQHDLEIQFVRPDPGTDLLEVDILNSYATVP